MFQSCWVYPDIGTSCGCWMFKLFCKINSPCIMLGLLLWALPDKCWCICIHCPQCGSITFVYPVFTPVHRYPPQYDRKLYCSIKKKGNIICNLWGKCFRRFLDVCSNIFHIQVLTEDSWALWSHFILHLFLQERKKFFSLCPFSCWSFVYSGLKL